MSKPGSSREHTLSVTCPSWWNWNRPLRAPLRFRHKLDELYAAPLEADRAFEGGEDSGVEWRGLSDLEADAARFLKRALGIIGWIYWRGRLARGECWVGFVRHLGAPTHYTFVSIGGAGLRMLRPISPRSIVHYRTMLYGLRCSWQRPARQRDAKCVAKSVAARVRMGVHPCKR